jgi:DNA (cytosine-5)-methyltransferase 1
MGTGGGNVPMVMEQVYCLQGNGIDRADTAGCNGRGWNDETCYTLNTIDRPAVAYCMTTGSYMQVEKEVSPTLMARDYKDPNTLVYWDGSQTAGTLTANNAGGNQRMPDKENFNCVIEHWGCTMSSAEEPIVFDKEVYQSGINAQGGHYISERGPAPALRTTGHPPGVCVAGTDWRNGRLNGDLSGTLQAKTNGGVSYNYIHPVIIKEPTQYIVRRLTPTECARLQGFPDEWGHIDHKDRFTPEDLSFWQEVRNTHATINGKNVKKYTEKQMLSWYNKLHTDSAEYKMWGNGIALPTALYCMEGIAEVLHDAKRSNSLHSPESLSASVDYPAI